MTTEENATVLRSGRDCAVGDARSRVNIREIHLALSELFSWRAFRGLRMRSNVQGEAREVSMHFLVAAKAALVSGKLALAAMKGAALFLGARFLGH